MSFLNAWRPRERSFDYVDDNNNSTRFEKYQSSGESEGITIVNRNNNVKEGMWRKASLLRASKIPNQNEVLHKA